MKTLCVFVFSLLVGILASLSSLGGFLLAKRLNHNMQPMSTEGLLIPFSVSSLLIAAFVFVYVSVTKK
jgi:hypothetical protein